jgi:hypothetical protein
MFMIIVHLFVNLPDYYCIKYSTIFLISSIHGIVFCVKWYYEIDPKLNAQCQLKHAISAKYTINGHLSFTTDTRLLLNNHPGVDVGIFLL